MRKLPLHNLKTKEKRTEERVYVSLNFWKVKSFSYSGF